MYIIGLNSDVLCVKKFNIFNSNKIDFCVINSDFLYQCLLRLKIFNQIDVNHKKLNILFSEVSRTLIVKMCVVVPFILILRGLLVHNNGPNLFFYPVNDAIKNNFIECLVNCRKVRECCYILYSYDGYIVNSKFYKNKIILNNSFVNKKLCNFLSIYTTFHDLNLKIEKCSGNFLLIYEISKISGFIQNILNIHSVSKFL